jgi:hypothetical protein
MITYDQETKLPKWLKSLQERSWELELLISGGAIFSLFQFSDLYLDWRVNLRMYTALPVMNEIFLIGMIGIKTLTLGFIIHLFMRAFWLAMVCLNYVFPEGIKTNPIIYKTPFYHIDEGSKNLQELIIKLDKICGIIISTSILAVFAITGIVLLSLTLLLLITLSNNTSSHLLETISTIWFIFILIYIADFISFGLIRKTPYISHLAYPAFKSMDVLSLRILYRKPLLVFTTNISKSRLLFSALLFASAATILTYFSIYKVMHWPNIFDQRDFLLQLSDNPYIVSGFYLDELSDGGRSHYYRAAINSKLQQGNYLEFFLTYERRYDHLIDQLPDSIRTLPQIVKLSIGEREINNINWFPALKPDDIAGISCMIPISEFDNGHYNLKVNILNPGTGSNYFSLLIPFWIDRSN